MIRTSVNNYAGLIFFRKPILSLRLQQYLSFSSFFLIICGQVGLADKLNTIVGALSGGMKRKLSLGIALIGNSKVLTPLFSPSFLLYMYQNILNLNLTGDYS